MNKNITDKLLILNDESFTLAGHGAVGNRLSFRMTKDGAGQWFDLPVKEIDNILGYCSLKGYDRAISIIKHVSRK